MKNILIVILLLVVGGGAFYGGTVYQKSTYEALKPLKNEVGLLTEVTDTLLTMRQGTVSKTIYITASSSLRSSRAATVDDYKLGDEVSITPQSINSDGSIIAATVIRREYNRATTINKASSTTP